ncbi:hypothetical protein HDV00_012220 [Rhizophlyctis rosea]|nr:hypothetical protein HDV00_012220 [Rhizophlyctis rosea]
MPGPMTSSGILEHQEASSEQQTDKTERKPPPSDRQRPAKPPRKPFATERKSHSNERKFNSKRTPTGTRLIPLSTLDPAAKELVSRFRDALEAPEVNYPSVWGAFLELAKNKQALQSLHTFHDQRPLLEGLLTYRDRKTKIEHISQALSDLAKANVGDEYNYVFLSRAYGPTMTYDSARSILEQVKTDGLKPNTAIYSNILHQLGIAERWDDFNRLWKDMTDNGVEKNAITMKTMFWACLKQQHLTKAEEYLEEAAKLGGKAKDAWGALIQAYTAIGDKATCQRLLRRIRSLGIEVDRRMYSSMVDAALEKDDLTEANQLMNTALKTFPPKECVVILAQFAKYLCDRGEMTKAEALMERGRGKGMVPDMAVYVILINGYGSKGELEEAKRMYDRMVEEGIKPGRQAKSALLKAYTKAGSVENMEQAEEFVRDIGQADAQVCVTMVDGYLRCHYAGGARRWIEKMKGLDVRPEVKKTLLKRFREVAGISDDRRERMGREEVWDEVEQGWVDARGKGYGGVRRDRRDGGRGATRRRRDDMDEELTDDEDDRGKY